MTTLLQTNLTNLENQIRAADNQLNNLRWRRVLLFLIRQELLLLLGQNPWQPIEQFTQKGEQPMQENDHGHDCTCQECIEENQTIIPNEQVHPIQSED